MMGGMTVIHRPAPDHSCRPGWDWVESTGEGPADPPRGTRCGVPPSPWRYPAGTVWACDCGRTWVSCGSPALHMPGVCTWRREGRFERWRRERQAAKAEINRVPNRVLNHAE